MQRCTKLSIALLVFFLGVFHAGASLAAADGPLEIESTAVVFRYANADPYDRANLYGFNHAPSVTTLSDGRLMAAWFSGPHEASVHQVILAAHSSDGGRSWSKAALLYDTPRRSDFDPAFIRDGQTTWSFFSAGRWTRYPFLGVGSRNKLVGAGSFTIFARQSTNAGRTWSTPVTIADGQGWNCRSNGVRLSTGELIVPVHNLNPPHKAAVLRSTDGGKSWQLSSMVTTPGRIGAAEPSVAELAEGKLLMVVRSRDGFLWTSTSNDRGADWNAAVKTEMTAAAASHNLLRMADGALVLTHNPTKPPLRTLLTMRVSRDGGRAWSEPLPLASVEAAKEGEAVWSRQVSYPSVTTSDEGSLLAVWTEIELSAGRQSGVIHAARVRLFSME